MTSAAAAALAVSVEQAECSAEPAEESEVHEAAETSDVAVARRLASVPSPPPLPPPPPPALPPPPPPLGAPPLGAYAADGQRPMQSSSRWEGASASIGGEAELAPEITYEHRQRGSCRACAIHAIGRSSPRPPTGTAVGRRAARAAQPAPGRWGLVGTGENTSFLAVRAEQLYVHKQALLSVTHNSLDRAD
jgi:hypothetical protein